jgi:hypothetical protein
MKRHILHATLRIALLAWLLTPATSRAQLTPLNAAGKWTGGVTMVDFTDAPYCEWSGPMSLEITQTGNTITGNVKSEFRKARRLRDVNLPCNPYPARDDQLNGTISGSRIEFTIRSATYTGTFTSDLMKGSFSAGALNRGGVRGCFQLTRSGALPECKP